MLLSEFKVGVIGGSQGLGAWFVSFLKSHQVDTYFTSADAYSQFADNAALCRFCDVVLLAVPISEMETTLAEIYPHLQGKILLELCSVKKFVVEKFMALQSQQPAVEVSFHSFHPMFSQSLKSLEGHTLIENFDNQKNDNFWAIFKNLLLAQGAKWETIDYETHDKMMGIVQGLNHFGVFVSAKTLFLAGFSLNDVKKFSSPPYRIFLVFFTRYVLQNPRLYADIQIYNGYVVEVLRVFKAETEKMLNLIENRNTEGFAAYIREMQPYFAANDTDTDISNHLIQQLGEALHKK